MPSILGSLPVFRGEKPDIPAYAFVDPAEQQRRALQGNLTALPLETQLAQRTNLANLQGTEQLFGQAMPGFSQMRGLTEDALLAYLRGEVPRETASSIARSANARAFAGGYGGSGMSGALTARDLGRTADEFTRYGIEASQAYARGNPLLAATPRYAVGQSFLAPEFVTQFERAQQDAAFNRNLLASQVAAAPDPWAAHLGSTLDSLADTAMSMAASYGGGLLGGGQGTKRPRYGPQFDYGDY